MQPGAHPPIQMPPRERVVTCLYADGQSAAEISAQTRLAPSTIYSYVAHARRRYLAAGRLARSKLDLRARLMEEGHLPPDTAARSQP